MLRRLLNLKVCNDGLYTGRRHQPIWFGDAWLIVPITTAKRVFHCRGARRRVATMELSPACSVFYYIGAWPFCYQRIFPM